MSHFIEVWRDCGHVNSQCRCPSTSKATRYKPGKCPKCNAAPAEKPTESEYQGA